MIRVILSKLGQIYIIHGTLFLLPSQNWSRHTRQNFLQAFQSCFIKAIRKHNFEEYEKSTFDIRIVNVRHSFVLHHLQLFVLGDLSRLGFKVQCSVVHVSHHKIESTQTLRQRKFFVENNISALSFEDLVRLLLDHKNHVSRQNAGCFIRLFMESNFLPVFHPGGYIHFQHFSLFDDLLSHTFLALIFWMDHFPLSLALSASPLQLLHHSRRDLPDLNLHPLAIAPGACFLRTNFSSASFTAGTYSVPIDGQTAGFAIIEVFQGNFDRMN
mmetsp:Transcript_17022/g.25165  ORF Transcript_17022/g.25165 Transcript_17022/m.25165 type:complete len:270 (+) Transcript_17022:255-1064(+)